MINSNKIKVNLEKAKEIHKDNLRRARSKEFQRLDIEFMKALESGDSAVAAEIAAKKETLRNITDSETITNITNPEDLKFHWPEVLNCESCYELVKTFTGEIRDFREPEESFTGEDRSFREPEESFTGEERPFTDPDSVA